MKYFLQFSFCSISVQISTNDVLTIFSVFFPSLQFEYNGYLETYFSCDLN